MSQKNLVITRHENSTSFFEMMDEVKKNKIYYFYSLFFPQYSDSLISYVIFSDMLLKDIDELVKLGEKEFLAKYSELYSKENEKFSIFKANILKDELKPLIEIFIRKYFARERNCGYGLGENLFLSSGNVLEFPNYNLIIKNGIFSLKELKCIRKIIQDKPDFISDIQKKNISNISFEEFLKLYAVGRLYEIYDINSPIMIGEKQEIESVENYLKRVKERE